MGQKVNPLGFRLGVSQKHISHWFIENNKYSELVVEDQFIRDFFYKRFPGIASINIKRDLNRIFIEIFSANTRDLLMEGGQLAAKATLLPSKKTRPVERSSTSISEKGESSGSNQINSLCDQLLKALTMYRHTRSQTITFKNKNFLRSEDAEQRNGSSSTSTKANGGLIKEQTMIESDSANSLDMIELSPQAEASMGKKPFEVELFLTKVENPSRSAACLADFIVEQLEKRVPFRRVLKRSIQKAEEGSVEGIKVQISGRLNGAEIARSERIHKGQVPLHTLRAKIEYNSRTAKTIYGLLGVKVWVFNGFADLNETKSLNKK